MLGKKDSEAIKTSGELNTIIGKGSSFEGTLNVQSTIRVDGRVKGKITASDSLVVGKEGDIDGEVHVRNAILGGKVFGKLNVAGKVVLEAKAVFNGELKTSKLVIDEGAVFEGSCSMVEGKLPESRNDGAESQSAGGENKSQDQEAKAVK